MMKKTTSLTLKLVVSLLFIAGFCVADASAQTVSGTLRGTVSDPTGALVPNATVTVRSTETGLERTVTTNEEGLYNMPFLPIGNYTVEVSRTDFSKVSSCPGMVAMIPRRPHHTENWHVPLTVVWPTPTV